MLLKVAQRQDGAWRVFILCNVFLCGSFILTAPGTRALNFIDDSMQFIPAHLGLNTNINCTTDDPNATVTLLHSQGAQPLQERPLQANKIVLNEQVFTVLNIIVSDGGIYSCKATSQSGTTITRQNNIVVVVRQITLPKHFVLIPNRAIIVIPGQSRSIVCESEGSALNLKWEKRIAENTYKSVDPSWVTTVRDPATNMVRATLRITNAKPSDDADYKCTVTVQSRTDHIVIKVNVKAPTAPTISQANEDRVIKEGEEHIIRCDAEGVPKPVVTWYRKGQRVNKTDCKKSSLSCKGIAYEVYEVEEHSADFTSFTYGVLKVRSALYHRDQGKFRCEASNGNSPPAELIVNLDVRVAPQISKETKDKLLLEFENEETQVSCNLVKSNPLPTFKWFFQPSNCGDVDIQKCFPVESKWNQVPPKNIFPATSTPTNRSIVKIASDRSDSFYRCQAFSSAGNDSLVIIFRRRAVVSKIEVDKERTKTELNENSVLEVYCIDRCYGFCGVIKFFRDGKRLLSADDLRININSNSSSGQQERMVLTITNATVNDSGLYRCELEFERPSVFDSINITVKELIRPTIFGLSDQAVIQEDNGEQVELKCDVSGHPPPNRTWFFYWNDESNGKEVLVTSDLRGDVANCESRQSGFFYLRQSDPSQLVICHPNYEKHQGKYVCLAKNFIANDTKYAYVNIEMAPVITKEFESSAWKIGETLNLTCEAKGNPAPNVTWRKNSTGEMVKPSEINSNRLIIKSLKEDDFGIYECIASNKLNTAIVSVKVEQTVVYPSPPTSDALSTGALVGIAIGVGLVVLVILVVCCCLYRRQKKQINEYKQLYFLQQSDYKIDPDRSLLEQCNDLPYDPDWEFPEERLILGNVLGAGAFGQVVQAEAIGILALNPRDKSAESFKRRSKIRRSSRAKDLKKEEGSGGWKSVKIPVAVKTLKEGATKEEYKDLASELKILIHLGQNKNIVNLLGACTRGKRLMVIMEFAPHGSLLSFLRGKRETYDASWTKTMNDPEKEFTLVDLVMIGFQVARGMSFLAAKKCVHRDLAARNILVGDDYVMKIADFGLARDIYKDDLYIKKTQGLLPVKWMAPESLFDRIYTEKTDVWSFGILLWETFTLGGTPYPGLPTEQLLDYLSDGKRMEMPSKCPLEVYTIMRDCWIHEPNERPQFKTLTERLANILEKNTSKENPYLALQMDEEAQPSQGYYLQPVDETGIRESKRYVKSPVQSPTSDPNESPKFEHAANADPFGYNSPLPAPPPGMSDEDIPSGPLPPLPPDYENTRSNSAGGESGIDMDGADEGYVDDARMDSPFLPRVEHKPLSIEMDNVKKVPEAKVMLKGSKQKYETPL
ncbi:fibroblast growth factor receptor 4-like isoform X1 [Montipora foliosa]|uniref:fibroblast growth factor receptor 4-like isoform X1 n=1 Tax=Montipora foliosa TaxID=591990 RepID=UPI0035F1D304